MAKLNVENLTIVTLDDPRVADRRAVAAADLVRAKHLLAGAQDELSGELMKACSGEYDALAAAQDRVELLHRIIADLESGA